ncbi:MAG TPA: hypothetical protein VGI60_02210 [Chthoniobacterales bacterium]|jgi:hypothetical protein
MKLRIYSQSAAGNTLIVTLMTMVVVGVLVDLALQYTNAIGRNVDRSLSFRQGVDIGDGATEMAFSAWRAICRQNQTKIYKRSDVDTEIPTPTPGDFPNSDAFTIQNYAIYPLDSYWNTKTGGASTPAPIAGPNHGDLSYYYLAQADVIVPTSHSKNATLATDKGNVVAHVRRVLQKETLSLWRYAAFFNDDLEIHPSLDTHMNITGDVHSNGSLYTGHNSLTLSGKTTYTDTWAIGFMPGDNTHPETPTAPHWATGLPPASDTAQQPYGVALDDYHALIDYTSSSTPLDPYRLQMQAGYVVTIDASNNVKIYNGAGTDITNKSGGSNDAKAARALQSAVTTNGTITDNREGATTGNGSVRVATLDLGVVESAMDSPTSTTSFTISKTITGTATTVSNLIYVVDTSADPHGIAAKRAIRLKNGGKLPDGGLTVVSGNPVYIQGDYNTGTTGSLQPASNNASSPDPTQPTVAGYTRQPAAVVADAVNVLSNAWLDSKSGSTPVASPTTVNAAIISGTVPSGNGYYSGGLENFPRFLENWDGKSFTYYGSMIELYKSQQAIGRWGASNVYSPPNRAWYFDTNFIANPPPGLLASFDYKRSRWYLQ